MYRVRYLIRCHMLYNMFIRTYDIIYQPMSSHIPCPQECGSARDDATWIMLAHSLHALTWRRCPGHFPPCRHPHLRRHPCPHPRPPRRHRPCRRVRISINNAAVLDMASHLVSRPVSRFLGRETEILLWMITFILKIWEIPKFWEISQIFNKFGENWKNSLKTDQGDFLVLRDALDCTSMD